MSVLCVIAARGGSKGVKNKNIRILRDKPLIAYTIQQAIESGIFDHIIVSSDSDEIIKISKQWGAEIIFKRSHKLATDTAGKTDVIRHALKEAERYYGVPFDYVVDLDATAPLRRVVNIREAFRLFLEKDYDNLITAVPSRKSPYFNMLEVVGGKVRLSKKPQHAILRRQDAPKTYAMNASIYIWKRNILLTAENSLFLDKTGLYIMPEESAVDIDTELDFKFIEFLIKEGMWKDEEYSANVKR